jgi:hypothetical protein
MQRGRDFSRRSFLKAMGVSAAASPFLPLLNASGQQSSMPKRLLLFFTPHGTIIENWKPSGSGTNFTLGSILQPLNPFKNKLVVLGNMQMSNDDPVGAPHTKGLPLLWTGSKLLNEPTFNRPDGSGGFTYGWNSAPSVDQVLVQKLVPGTTYDSVELGLHCYGKNPASRMIYKDLRFPLDPNTDPQAAFNSLFSGLNQEPAAALRARQEKQSVIDVVKAELDSLNADLAVVDRHKLDAHLTAVRDLEKTLVPPANTCNAPDIGGAVNSGTIANRPTLIKQQFDIISGAFACDLTRIASVQFSVGDNDENPYPFLGINETHHLSSHGEGDATIRANRTKINNWYAQQFAYLLDRLNSVPEGNGTMLDNTMVVWGSELGDAQNHGFQNVPFIVAGGGAQGVKTGQYLDTGGAYHNRLLVSICRYFGRTEVNTFGNLDNASGPLSGLLV